MTRPAVATLDPSRDWPWLSDQGNGTYRNPVLYADYSDPDAIRVGNDYWLTSSSFCHVPGLPILHSRDLINWTLVNHALPKLTPVEHYRQPRHGQGVWAPSLRYHAGKYWIFYPDPDFGIYAITADDPRDSWSEPALVKGGRGLIDPCPLWDDDGAVYLIVGWARSRAGISNLLTLYRLSDDGKRVVDEGTVIIDGNKMRGWTTIEGPKLYKRNGYYYVFAPAGGVGTGYQAVFRSRQIVGPYEEKIVLHQGSTPINGPHQGAWVDTPSGEEWFLHFQEVPAYGRIMHLQPMRWVDDWPVMGVDVDGDGRGEPVTVHRKPCLPVAPLAAPATSDEFDEPRLGRQWQWQANPQPDWASLTAAPGRLRLRCVARPDDLSLWTAGHLLMQKFPAPSFVTTTRVQLVAAHDGDTAGLIVFGFTYAWLGLQRRDTGYDIALYQCVDAQRGTSETQLASVTVNTNTALLRVAVGSAATCRFSYSVNDREFIPIGPPLHATSSYWVGAKVGVFALAGSGAAPAGCANIDWFRITPSNRTDAPADAR
jgi:beta-xylosidase